MKIKLNKTLILNESGVITPETSNDLSQQIANISNSNDNNDSIKSGYNGPISSDRLPDIYPNDDDLASSTGGTGYNGPLTSDRLPDIYPNDM